VVPAIRVEQGQGEPVAVVRAIRVVPVRARPMRPVRAVARSRATVQGAVPGAEMRVVAADGAERGSQSLGLSSA
jgi:hypothetical protein